MELKKGQSWSFDIALAAVVIISTLIVFLTIANNDKGEDLKRTTQEADYLLDVASSDNPSLQIIEGNEVNGEKLSEVASTPYDQLKREVRVKNDFCIYMEDENGNVIPIEGSNGIGSETINVSGVPCG